MNKTQDLSLNYSNSLICFHNNQPSCHLIGDKACKLFIPKGREIMMIVTSLGSIRHSLVKSNKKGWT